MTARKGVRGVLACCVILATIIAATPAEAQAPSDCGQQGKACCCKALDWQNPRCCSSGLQCTMFSGQGFGFPPVVQSACLPKAAAAAAASSSPKGCGAEGGPCCISTSSNGGPQASCSSGLSCMPPSSGWGSKAQLEALSGGFAAAVGDPAVMGTCRKFTVNDCGKAFMPCGKDIAAAGVTCPGSPAACPSGFYCAAKFDAGVGERCIPLPKNAGSEGAPCLPNNLPAAPVVKFSGKELAPAFCRGTAVCFSATAGDTTGFTHGQPAQAKSLASRISGTRCINVPSDCGSAPGKPCCPSGFGVVTDKPLPSTGTAWANSPCSGGASKYGMWCEGSYVAFGGQPMGTCRANPECGGDKQPCCKYSKPEMAGVACPNLGGPGAGYCSLSYKCKLCPKTLDLVEDLLRCY
uniref:Granulins domain-containing protein n=1 Tax=Tetradesmus obliquus TaxID=3088 RepID=A0A383WHI1_TETOB|eukprot:jgi/Sobl393_1/8310/SZX76947.1